MKNKKLFGMLTLIVGIMLVFGFAACDNGNGENEDKTLAAGTYNGTPAYQAQCTTGAEILTYRLDGITNMSFTVDADGVITDLSFGQGGSSFLVWTQSSATQYRFTLSGSNLNFQFKQYCANDFTSWNQTFSISGEEYKQSISGTLNSLKFLYEKTDSSGAAAWRYYSFTKQ